MNAGHGHQHDCLVLAAPDGRFAVLTRDRLLDLAAPVASVEDVRESFARVMKTIEWLSEIQVRARLADAGLSPQAIDDRLAAAARRLTVMASQPTIMERITKVGYRNADGQEVIGRTDRQRDGQYVFVMRCTVCGYEYGSPGCDADIRRCPACQDGATPIPGV
jgi:hypothetical protein